MKKFIIRDEDKEYEVEEIETTENKTDPVAEKSTETHDESSLSEDEVVALKRLAAVADKLVGLVDKTDCSTTGMDADEDEDMDKDEVVDTDEDVAKQMHKDSKTSFGSIEQKVKHTDSFDDQELAIANAWAKRYGGNK